MKLSGEIALASGFIFDYSNMINTDTITPAVIETLESKAKDAADALLLIREQGMAKAHLSKDGTPEHVLFTKLPFVKNGNPNTPESIAKLKQFGSYLQQEIDAVVFLGVGGSYLGNKVLFDIFAGSGWNVGCEKSRHGYPRVYFSGNNLDVDQYSEVVDEVEYLATHRLGKNEQFRVLLVPISKSGTTLETLAAFSYFYEQCQKSSLLQMEVAVVTDLDEDISVGSTDMHAQTQQHQDGKKDKVIQFVEILEREQQIVLNNPFTHISSLKKYDGLSVDHALKIALAANEEALNSDGRLNAKYILPRIDEYYLGQLLYFLMLSVAYEGELADVDAYDQPGVETYKQIMKQKMSHQ